ncbi:GIY-YIG nuclease family protein [Actinomadura bangladeshensis]|uniref:GIY-YIG nuclease family protein n=1 Tax=Actinomadura bangladeshensis TaxID=453573 RepID=A0A6L9QBK1_9ACTN|nr:GIY-YIG nuclease family protein [Actinomadura bangladeshensis]NEA22625.1 GIY-YIG nuclease family protein [Actinomadura bangladeshensis]
MQSSYHDQRTVLYRFFDADGQLLYVGITDRAGTRWERHMSDQPWWPDVQRQMSEWYPSREQAEAAELTAIREERPLYNTMHAGTEPLGIFLLAEPWACRLCRWTTQDPVEQAEHMEHELRKLERRRRVPKSESDRLKRDLTHLVACLGRYDRVSVRAQASFERAVGARGQTPRRAYPVLTEREQRALLEDLDDLMGTERARLADLAVMLRRLTPPRAAYQNMTGIQLREILQNRGIRVTNTGNVLRLDPTELERVEWRRRA